MKKSIKNILNLNIYMYIYFEILIIIQTENKFANYTNFLSSIKRLRA